MTWVLYALLLSIVAALMAEANRYLKMDGFRLNFWRVVTILLFVFPLTLFVDWPEPSMFYVSAALVGTVAAISPAIRFTLSARKFGRVSTLFMPIEAFVGFGLWLLLDNTLREHLFNAPLQLTLVLGSMALATLALYLIRQNDAGWQAFLVVAPLGVLHALSGVFAKFVMTPSEVLGAIVVFIFCANIMALLLSTCFLALRNDYKMPLLPKGMVKAGLIYGVLGLTGQYCFFTAISMAGSPAYVVAIGMLAPVWIMLFHRLRGQKDDASPAAGVLMVLAAIGLVLVTSV